MLSVVDALASTVSSLQLIVILYLDQLRILVMANYGYIDRSGEFFIHPFKNEQELNGFLFMTGVTTATELLWAQQEMLGLGTDLAAALVGLTAISALDPTSYVIVLSPL